MYGGKVMNTELEELEYVSNIGETTSALVPYKEIFIYNNKIKEKIEKVIKRVIDIIVGITGTLVLVPITIGIFLANLISGDKGTIFYSQERIGKNGKIFKMYKFRSMVMGADEKLSTYLAENEEARDEYKKYKKIKNDPRVTKIGKFIRKTSLDEFPQFINVLKGDMSLVGPRPYLERERDDMKYFYRYIILCKPGITGLWQINGRSNVTFDDRVRMDMEYLKKCSLKVDVRILGQTVRKVVGRKGAV